MYEIVFGGNYNKSVYIRRCGKCRNEASGFAPLHCEGPNLFWIQWQDGILTVGSVSTGVAVVSYNDPNAPIKPKYISVSSWLKPVDWLVYYNCPEQITTMDDMQTTEVDYISTNAAKETTIEEYITTVGYVTSERAVYSTPEDMTTVPSDPCYANVKTTDYTYVNTGIEVDPISDVIFVDVKICGVGYVALHPNQQSDLTNMYELAFGEKNGQYVMIRRCGQCNEVTYGNSPTLCNSFVTFWITWNNGLLKIGQGYDTTQKAIVQYYDTTPIRPSYVSVASWNKTGEWTIQRQCLNITQPTTATTQTTTPMPATTRIIDDCQFASVSTSSYTYINTGILVEPDADFIFVDLHMCVTGHVGLHFTEVADKSNMYEIVFGGNYNKEIFIRKCGKCYNRAVGSASLNCADFNDNSFWIGWANGTLSVGYGSYAGENIIVSYDDDTPIRPRFVSVSSWRKPGQWIVRNRCSNIELSTMDDTTIDVSTTDWPVTSEAVMNTTDVDSVTLPPIDPALLEALAKIIGNLDNLTDEQLRQLIATLFGA